MLRRRRGRRSHGQSLVEFALVFPVAILIILAIFDAGRAVFVLNGITNAAREGARLAIVNQAAAKVSQRVEATAFGTGVTNAAAPNLVRYFQATPNAADPTANPACAAMATGCIAVVIVETQWQAITPIVGSILGPINMSARSELPVEFVCPNATITAYSNADSCPKQP